MQKYPRKRKGKKKSADQLLVHESKVMYKNLNHYQIKQNFFTPTTSHSSPINILIVIPSHVSKTIDTAPLPLGCPCKVVTGYISLIVVVVIAIPLRSFALAFALGISLLGGAGAAYGFRTLVQCWRLEVFLCCTRSWNSGGSRKMWRFGRMGNTFEAAPHALVVFEFFGAKEKLISAQH